MTATQNIIVVQPAIMILLVSLSLQPTFDSEGEIEPRQSFRRPGASVIYMAG